MVKTKRKTDSSEDDGSMKKKVKKNSDTEQSQSQPQLSQPQSQPSLSQSSMRFQSNFQSEILSPAEMMAKFAVFKECVFTTLTSMFADYEDKLTKFVQTSANQTGGASKKFPNEPKLSRSSLQLFIERKLKDKPATEELRKKYRQKFLELPEDKLAKWISKAIEDEERYLQECKEFVLKNPDFKPPNKKDTISTKERIIYQHHFKGRPDPPPRSAYAAFCKECSLRFNELPADPKERMKYYSDEWKGMSANQKRALDKKLTQRIRDYIDEMREYLKNQPKEEQDRIKSDESDTMPEYYLRMLNRRIKKETKAAAAVSSSQRINGV